LLLFVKGIRARQRIVYPLLADANLNKFLDCDRNDVVLRPAPFGLTSLWDKQNRQYNTLQLS